MNRFLYLLSICVIVLSSCDNEDEYTPSRQPVEENHNENCNVGGDDVVRRMETPHVNAAFLLVPHYVTVDGKQVLNYTVEWNAGIRHSTWVAFSWDSTTASEDETVHRRDNFKWDVDIPRSKGSVSPTDYLKNGYDRGHICASEDRVFSQEANDQTFYFSNMSPQFSSFNQGFWKELEAKVRSWGRATLTGRYDTVYVVKGGTTNSLLRNYEGHTKTSSGVVPMTDANGYSLRSDGQIGLPVPEYYYMALLSVKNGVYHAIAFMVPHSEDLPRSPKVTDLQYFVTTIDNLEYLTGIDFFCNLIDEKEKEVESNYSLGDWKW